MQVKGWKRMFLPHILERGEDYYLNGAVEDLEWDGESLVATVHGTEDYEVELWLSDSRVEDFSCSCPYAEDGTPCKHMAAVLFQFTAQDVSPKENEKKQAGKQEQGDTLEALVSAMSAADAKTLLLRLGREISAAETQIRLFATGKVPKKQQKDWIARITRLRREHGDRYGFIDYEHASDYALDLEHVMEEAVPMLLEAAMPMEAFEVVCTAFREASEVEMDDSDGERSMLWDSCAEYWEEILPAGDETQRGQMYAWFSEHARDKSLGDATDTIQRILFYDFPEEEYLRKNLELLDSWIGEPDSGSFHSYLLSTWLGYRLHTMEALSVTPAEREAWLRKYYALPFARECLLESAKEAGDWDEALRILREGLEIDREKPGLTDEYSRQMIEILREQGSGEELREALLEYVTERPQNSLVYVQELKSMTPPERWETLRETLLKAQGMRTMRWDLLLEEGEYRRLMDGLLSSENEWLMDRYAPELKKHYPAELLDFYLPRVERAMYGASNRGRYAELCGKLKTLRSYRGGKERTIEVAEKWRAAYPRRRAMLEELERAGF